MNVKNTIITGRHIKELEEALDVCPLHLQGLLGLYAPTVTRISSADMYFKPLDRVYCATIRFLLNNYHTHGTAFPMTMVFKRSTMEDLERTLSKSPLRIAGHKLDIKDHAHLGIVLFRGKSAARKFNMRDSQITLPIIQWINIVCHCVTICRADLIEDVILEEAEAHNITIEELMENAWTPLTNDDIKPTISKTSALQR